MKRNTSIILILVMAVIFVVLLGISKNHLENPYGLKVIEENTPPYKVEGEANIDYSWEYKTIVFPEADYALLNLSETKKKEHYLSQFVAEKMDSSMAYYMEIEQVNDEKNFSDITLGIYPLEGKISEEEWKENRPDTFFFPTNPIVEWTDVDKLEWMNTFFNTYKYYEVTYVLDQKYGCWIPCYTNQMIHYGLSVFSIHEEYRVNEHRTTESIIKKIDDEVYLYSIDYSEINKRGPIELELYGLTGDNAIYVVEPTKEQKEKAQEAFVKYRGRKQLWDSPMTTSFYDYETREPLVTIEWKEPNFPVFPYEILKDL